MCARCLDFGVLESVAEMMRECPRLSVKTIDGAAAQAASSLSVGHFKVNLDKSIGGSSFCFSNAPSSYLHHQATDLHLPPINAIDVTRREKGGPGIPEMSALIVSRTI